MYRPEPEEVKPQEEAETPEIVEYDRKTLENLIKDAEHTLNLMQDYWIQKSAIYICQALYAVAGL